MTRLQSYQATRTEATATGTDPAGSAATAFRPYKRSSAQSVSSKLITPFKSSQSGSIYIYTRASSPGYVKIGYSRDVQSRLKSWQGTCGYEPILLAAFDDVPRMRKAESLIHHQLADFWRTEQRCKRCSVEHKEWFEVKEDNAVKVAGQWVEWMKRAKPYYARGHLKGVWVDELERLKTKGIPATAEVLLSAHARLLEMELRAAEQSHGNDSTTGDTAYSGLYTDDLTAKPDTYHYQVQDLSNFLARMLRLVQGIDRSFQRAIYVLMDIDPDWTTSFDPVYTMSAFARSGRQDTNATVTSEA